MIIHRIIPFIFVLIFLYGCSKSSEQSNFEGDWYVIGADELGFTYWKISDENFVKADLRNPLLPDRFQIVSDDDGQYTLESEYLMRERDLGSIVFRDNDKVEFSSGFKMIRLIHETDTEFTVDKYFDILSNSIWNYELNGSKTKLYPNDSINLNGFYSALVVETGIWNAAERSSSWHLKSVNGKLVFTHLNSASQIVTILIEKANKNEFLGRLYIKRDMFYESVDIPVRVQRIKPADKDLIVLLSTIIAETEWQTHKVEGFELPETENVYLLWNSMLSYQKFETNRLKEADFVFSFKPDQNLKLSYGDKLLQTYTWEITNDGDFLLFFNERALRTFVTPLSCLEITRRLKIEFDYYISSDVEVFDLSENYLVFELNAK